jgi:hypothetical protein
MPIKGKYFMIEQNSLPEEVIITCIGENGGTKELIQEPPTIDKGNLVSQDRCWR